ncbi:UPF0262 family protein [Brevundimonas viscosa]|uniref:Uncharacterized protein, UPF0262 family n=1 Tax=Brevundimonas viscosa TaxID=871741 RepID=A0A1I6TG92_9CAUL|nr:UPF0262 family protein [Brevundimonas viscosa]SFS88242.1 Uncharacterized protein, UPF0262 family [Brevundimonas viscosa]
MSGHRLVSVDLDPVTLPPASAEIEHERRVAIFDLLEKNSFQPVGASEGPYRLTLSLVDGRLVLDVTGPDFSRAHGLSLTPLKKAVKDYIDICDSYYEVLRGADAGKIEAVDMGRRGLHNDGAELLKSRLEGKIVVDHETARRLFTLVTALYRR